MWGCTGTLFCGRGFRAPAARARFFWRRRREANLPVSKLGTLDGASYPGSGAAYVPAFGKEMVMAVKLPRIPQAWGDEFAGATDSQVEQVTATAYRLKRDVAGNPMPDLPNMVARDKWARYAPEASKLDPQDPSTVREIVL